MKLPESVETKLQDPEAIVLPRVTPVKNDEMIIYYHCEGNFLGETMFPYSPEAYADWLRSMADALSPAVASSGAA